MVHDEEEAMFSLCELHVFFVAISSATLEVHSRAPTFIGLTLHCLCDMSVIGH